VLLLNECLLLLLISLSTQSGNFWIQPHMNNEELHNLYSSQNIFRLIKPRLMRWAGHIASRGRLRNEYILVGKLQGKRPLGRSRCRRENNVKTDIRGVGCEGVDWIYLAQYRVQ
jgi:hypothetical protein